MKKAFLVYQVVVPVVILFLTTDCKKDEPAKLVVLSTISVKNFTTITAVSGGNITSDGGSEILSNGVCWSTTVNPVITDESGFTAVPAGYRDNFDGLGSCSSLGHESRWWSSTENSSADVYGRIIYSDEDAVFRGYYDKRNGLSVRCLQD